MEDILVGIIKFFGNIIEDIIYAVKGKKTILVGFIIVIICFLIVYLLTKDF